MGTAETRPVTIASELVRLAGALEPLNGEGRSAAVWSLDGAEPRLLFAGRHARAEVLEAAAAKLSAGEDAFEVHAGPGESGTVVVCQDGTGRAAYGLFVLGAGQPHLGRTLAGLIEAAEGWMGKSVAEMSRTEKQDVVRFLEERGAFLIRKAVEEVAGRLGVTRFTIYNYLDREGG